VLLATACRAVLQVRGSQALPCTGISTEGRGAVALAPRLPISSWSLCSHYED